MFNKYGILVWGKGRGRGLGVGQGNASQGRAAGSIPNARHVGLPGMGASNSSGSLRAAGNQANPARAAVIGPPLVVPTADPNGLQPPTARLPAPRARPPACLPGAPYPAAWRAPRPPPAPPPPPPAGPFAVFDASCGLLLLDRQLVTATFGRPEVGDSHAQGHTHRPALPVPPPTRPTPLAAWERPHIHIVSVPGWARSFCLLRTHIAGSAAGQR